jgi:hypothetical protein
MRSARTLDPTESIRAIKTGVDLERDALGMKDQAAQPPAGGMTQQFNTLVQIIKGGNGKEAADIRRAIEGDD